MISAIVLAPEPVSGDDTIRLAEIVVHSLGWLVAAVVAGVVRDVTLAAPAGLGLADLADQAGCDLVQAETEAERLAAGRANARTGILLIMRAGFLPDRALISEIEDLLRHAPQPRGLVLSTPKTFLERLFPDRATPVGALAPVAVFADAPSFGKMVRSVRPAVRFRHRAAPIGGY